MGLSYIAIALLYMSSHDLLNHMYPPIKCKMVNDRLALKDHSHNIICLFENAPQDSPHQNAPYCIPRYIWIMTAKKMHLMGFERQRNNVFHYTERDMGISLCRWGIQSTNMVSRYIFRPQYE